MCKSQAGFKIKDRPGKWAVSHRGKVLVTKRRRQIRLTPRRKSRRRPKRKGGNMVWLGGGVCLWLLREAGGVYVCAGVGGGVVGMLGLLVESS